MPGSPFNQKTPDDEWLSEVGKKGWIVFSHDRKWHDELAAREAIKQHSVGCFYLWGAQVPTWDKLVCFTRACKGIMKLATTTGKPFIFHVTVQNRILPVRIP